MNDYLEIMYGIIKKVDESVDIMKDGNDIHKEWINYFEGVIDKDGLWHDLHGSHNDLLLYLAAEQMDLTVTEIDRLTPDFAIANYDSFLSYISRGIIVRYDLQIIPSNATDISIKSLNELVRLRKIKKNFILKDSMEISI